MLESLEKIHFNIWDDYEDDGSDTDGYIEEEEHIPDEEAQEFCEFVCQYIHSLGMGINAVVDQGTVEFKNLPHDVREELVKKLQQSGLEYKGRPISFYSES